MRLAEALAGLVAPTPAPVDPVLSTISSATAFAQELTRLPLNEALRECTHLYTRYDHMTPAERETAKVEIDRIRRHIRVLAALARCAHELERIA